MAKQSRKLNIVIVTGLEGKGTKEAIKDVQKLGKNIQSLSGTALKAAAAFAAFKGGKIMADFAKTAIGEATQLERNVAALGNIFGEQAPAMAEYAQNASRIGLNMNEAAGAATFLGSVIKQAGFSLSETSEMTKTLIDLSADLAITYNRDVAEALNAIAALFRGEYDPIEKFGVGMKQNEIESLKAERGLEKLTGRAEIFADVMVRYEQLLIRSADAQGAFGEQSESLFALQEALGATFENVQMAVGLGLTPAFAKLTANMIPLVESFAPVLINLFDNLIPVVEALTANKDKLAGVLVKTITLFGMFLEVVLKVTAHVIEHIEAYKNIAIIAGTVLALVKAWGLVTGAISAASVAAQVFNINLAKINAQLKITKARVAATGFGLLAIGIGAAAVALGVATDDLDETLDDVNTDLEEFNLEDFMGQVNSATAAVDDVNSSLEETSGAASQAKDAVGDFFRGLQDEARKQSAKLQLEALGASEGLINAVLGSGEEWYKVFARVTRQGAESVREVQALFAQTPAGFDEAMQEFEEQKKKFEDFKKAATEAKDALVDFVRGFEILPTIERELGRFEQAAVTQLENIEDKLDDAFDNGYLLEQSYKDLQQYARQEFQVLSQIERQRDDLLRRRNAAEQLINSVNDAVLSSGRLVNVLRDVQQETQNVDMVKVVKDTIEEASGLREFEVILTSAVIEPIEEVQSKSQQLVSGYQNIVDRTRRFVENMKALRALGLDPQLFNELVEAGVDAGGATAEALIEGGSDTVREVNSLFAELNSLGEELGEETAQVMYGQGEMFVDGIVNGLEAQAAQLEEQAIALATAFTDNFEALLISGIELAIAKATVALGKMPTLEGMPQVSKSTSSGTSGGTSSSSSLVQGINVSDSVSAMVAARRQSIADMQNSAAIAAQAASDARKASQKASGAARQAAQQEKISVTRTGDPDPNQKGGVYYNVINSPSRADGASVAKTISNYTSKNTARVSQAWQSRTLRAF